MKTFESVFSKVSPRFIDFQNLTGLWDEAVIPSLIGMTFANELSSKRDLKRKSGEGKRLAQKALSY